MAVSYLIFHPERIKVRAKGRAQFAGSNIVKNWAGTAYVDSLVGNQDPYVWHEPWLYSYCQATRLRRLGKDADARVDAGSILFFCEREPAKAGTLVVDTVFVVGGREPWRKNKVLIPHVFRRYQNDCKTSAWIDHFRYGVRGGGSYQHPGVITFTGERGSLTRGSFLPYRQGLPIQIAVDDVFGQTGEQVRLAAIGNLKTHYSSPFRMDQKTAMNLYKTIYHTADTRVVALEYLDGISDKLRSRRDGNHCGSRPRSTTCSH